MKKFTANKTGLNLLMINAFIYISFSMYTPYLSSYFSKAGINAVEIGILLTIGPVISILIQPIWAVISDKTGKRKVVLSIVVLGNALAILSFYIGKSFASFFIASTLLAVFNTSLVPLSDAIILRSAHKNQLDFSKIRMGGTIGYAVFVIFSGIIVRQNPDLAFVMGCISFFILFLFVRLLPKDETEKLSGNSIPSTAGPSSDKQENASLMIMKSKRPSPFHIFESGQIYFLLVFAFISQVGLSFNYSFLGVYMLDMGLSEGTIGLINCISALSELPVLFLMNRVLKKLDTTKVAIIACLLLGLRIITVTGGSLPFVALSQTMHGLTFMTLYIGIAVFISKNVKPENQSRGQSILALIQTGIGSITGNILGGYLVDAYGLKAAYTTMTLLVVTVAGLVALLQYFYLRMHKSAVL
jgi:PPP family 3-phenylpropionic acid transporter